MVAVGSLYPLESPETQVIPAVEWADSPDNILLLSALLEEKGAEYDFERGNLSAADSTLVRAILSDQRAEGFWQSKAPLKIVSDRIIREEEKRLQSKAEYTLNQALGEKGYKQVLVRLDYTIDESRRRSFEPRELGLSCTEIRDNCTPLIFEPVPGPPVRIVKMDVLALIEEPDDKEILEATRKFVSYSIGYDEMRKDKFTLISVPSTEQLREVYRWSRTR